VEKDRGLVFRRGRGNEEHGSGPREKIRGQAFQKKEEEINGDKHSEVGEEKNGTSISWKIQYV
jgi:hypothetical protein